MKRTYTREHLQQPRLLRKGNAAYLQVDGKPLVLLAGELHNSSSSSLKYMSGIWDRLVELNCNAVLAPISWELVEPEEGRFDFTLLDGLIQEASRRRLKLIPLWFGTWKNTWSSYAPGWVKTDLDRFPRSEAVPGTKLEAITCLSEAAAQADARAFAAVMRRIHAVDTDATVVMVQVENETGLLGAARDHSELANRCFAQQVPPALTQYLCTQRSCLRPELLALWMAAGARDRGTWTDVFGASADELFMAWHTASFVERVAASGKAEHNVPMFANAWLVQFAGQGAGAYPSGGPVSRMMDVWKCAAPHVDMLAPDIYLEDFPEACRDYCRHDNPLLIPEARRDETAAANVLCAIGEYHAMGFAPFGIDSMGTGTRFTIDAMVPEGVEQASQREHARLLSQNYRLLSELMPVLLPLYGTPHLRGFVQYRSPCTELDIGSYRLRVVYAEDRQAGRTPGAGLIAMTAPDEFVIAGQGFRVEFLPGHGSKRYVFTLRHEEGHFADGQWVPGRRMNGDEHTVRLGRESGTRRVWLYSHD